MFGRDFADQAAPEMNASDQDSDLPKVVGIVGRLPDNAVALIARSGVGARSISLGETIDGWQLKALSADTALFVRGSRNVRVKVSADTSDQ